MKGFVKVKYIKEADKFAVIITEDYLERFKKGALKENMSLDEFVKTKAKEHFFITLID